MDTRAANKRNIARLLTSIGAIGLAVGLVYALPALVGVSWSAIGSHLSQVPVIVLIGLVALWFSGLLVHAPVLMAAMPGLNARQALTLNMSGSAVSNVLPMGGPAGMGLGYAMSRSWGFGADRYASFLVSTNLWNMVGRFVAGISILGGAALLGARMPSGITPIILGAVAFSAVSAGSVVAALRSPSATAAFGRRLDKIARRLRPDGEAEQCSAWLVSSRAELITAVRAGWLRMSSGVLAYLFLQATLLYACLAATGAGAPVRVVAIAFAIERLISLAPITPGAAGVAEVGTVAALHSMGADPLSAASGVLLYRIFMFAIDIPVGTTLTLLWLRATRRAAVPIQAQEPVAVWEPAAA